MIQSFALSLLLLQELVALWQFWWLGGGGIYIREVLAGENKRKTKVCLFFCKKNKSTGYEGSHCNIDVGGNGDGIGEV